MISEEMDFTNAFYLACGFILGGMIIGGLAVFFDRYYYRRRLEKELVNHPEYKVMLDVLDGKNKEKEDVVEDS